MELKCELILGAPLGSIVNQEHLTMNPEQFTKLTQNN